MTTQKITIEPVTRIEGHAKVTVHMNEDGTVNHAYMHVNEFRGFEKFCEGRLYFEMPSITPRICGICPVSHHLAPAKAGDALTGQMPQMRGVIEGISKNIRPSQNFSKPLNSFTWKTARSTFPFSFM
ncbi:MAG: hypothetical protein EHM81_13485 [Chloroflexi bacterium]|nr:MAG: hypothetical protein EHM81_13485 [Chloroflexota bacterium]